MSALLFVDLEGVMGVDRLDALVFGTAAYAAAREALHAEVALVAPILRSRFGGLVVADTHQSGSGAPNLDPARVEGLRFDADPYDAPGLWDGVRAVACLGMHAAAGRPGFAAHTVNLHCAWWSEGRSLSETDLVLALAAERGVPVLFVSGDDALERDLGGRVPFVRTKLAEGLDRASSLDARAALIEAARGPGVVPSARIERVELEVKSAWQRRYGGVFAGPRWYAGALAAVERSAVPASALRGELGSAGFVEDLEALLRRGFAPRTVAAAPGVLAETYAAFLELSAGADEEAIALRALILHMLETRGPAFAALGAAPELERALDAAAAIPARFSDAGTADLVLARLDAWYLRRSRGLPHPTPRTGALRDRLVALAEDGELLYAWLGVELARQLGLELGLDFASGEPGPAPPWRGLPRRHELYGLTHEILLATRYLHAPLVGHEMEVEALILGARWALGEGHLDLAAELALCLQAAGEGALEEHALLVEGLLAGRRGGALIDRSMGVDAAELADHATGVALLVLAGLP